MSAVGIIVGTAIVAVAAALMATEGRLRTVTFTTALLIAGIAWGATAVGPSLDQTLKWVSVAIAVGLFLLVYRKRPKSTRDNSSGLAARRRRTF